MRSFEDSLNAHKSELTEALIVFGEHKRVNKVLAEVEMQRPDFYKFYKEGLESRQTEVDEQQKRLDAVKQLIEEYRDPPTEDKTFQHALSIVADELEQALKGGSNYE